MNKIVVYRTHIEINDYNLGDCPSLERTFSIYDMTYHKRIPKGQIYDEERRVLMLPRGIDIGFLERLLCTEPVVSADIDPAGDIGKVQLKYKPRDEVQIEAIKFMLNMDKYSRYDYTTMKSVNLNTGKGKTYCAIATAAYLSLRSIVITDSIGWLQQWEKFFIEYTDIQQDEIYLISGAPSLMKLYNRDISKYKVILSTHSTLKSIGDKQGWDKIADFFKYCQIGIKFFDEAHLNFDNMFQIDCYSNTFITYYLTATPGRSDMMENNIFGLYFKNVPSINLFDVDRDPHTKYAAIRFNSNPNPVEATQSVETSQSTEAAKPVEPTSVESTQPTEATQPTPPTSLKQPQASNTASPTKRPQTNPIMRPEKQVHVDATPSLTLPILKFRLRYAYKKYLPKKMKMLGSLFRKINHYTKTPDAIFEDLCKLCE